LSGKLAGGLVTEPSVRIKVEPQQLSEAVMLFASTETIAQVLEG
jgi:hypothetical protein